MSFLFSPAGFALYLLDATFRIAQRMHVTPADGASQASDDGTLATLTFRWSRVADVMPSQIMWVNIPSVSILHWRPVSVAQVQLDDVSDPNSSGTVTVHYKAYGAWTKVSKGVGVLLYAYFLCSQLPSLCEAACKWPC